MNHQDFRKSVDSEVFLNTHLLLASFALVPTVYHLLCLDELVQAVLNSDVTRDAIRAIRLRFSLGAQQT
jgi:hypothetical protein